VVDANVAIRLNNLFCLDLMTWKLPKVELQLAEPEFTGQVLMPKIIEFVKGLRHKSLVVNGDRYSPTSSLHYAQMSFMPDIEILEFGRRLLALEVKMIRDGDPSGAFTKSLGQALIYKSLGFDFAHVMLFDCRSQITHAWLSKSTGTLSLPSGIGVTVFGTSSSENLDMVFQTSPE